MFELSVLPWDSGWKKGVCALANYNETVERVYEFRPTLRASGGYMFIWLACCVHGVPSVLAFRSAVAPYLDRQSGWDVGTL